MHTPMHKLHLKLCATAVAIGAAALAGSAVLDTARADTAPAYQIVDGAIADSLTGVPGDPEKGKQVMLNRRLGNCVACHEISAFADQPFHGEIGPPLDGAGDRWTPEELRAIVANPKAIFEGTIMPAFYRTDGFSRVADKFENKTILSAQDVEDVIAYLKTFKE